MDSAPAKLSLKEARRIQREPAADNLWKKGALTVPVLDAIIARKEAASAYEHPVQSFLGYATFPLAALFAVGLFRAYSENNLQVDFGTSFAVVMISLLVSFIILVGVAGVFSVDVVPDKDLELARVLRAELPHEEHDLAVAESLLNGDQPFVLYLRGFDIEVAAKSAGQVNYERALLDQQRTMPVYMPDPESVFARRAEFFRQRQISSQLAALRADWETHRTVLAAVTSLAPVVCFGNIFLGGDKCAAMKELGVVTVTLVNTDWWPVFQRFAERAGVVVMFLETLTPAVGRELTHLASARLPLIVASTAAMRARLSDKTVLDAIQSNPAVREVMVTADNAGDLAAAVAEAMKERRQEPSV